MLIFLLLSISNSNSKNSNNSNIYASCKYIVHIYLIHTTRGNQQKHGQYIENDFLLPDPLTTNREN